MRKLLIALAGATALTAASGANATTFTGTTLGCFGGGCTVANASATGGASFTSGTFNQADAGGFLSIGSGTGTDTLGLIAVDGVSSSWVNVPFTLQVLFTAPTSTNAIYTALLSG